MSPAWQLVKWRYGWWSEVSWLVCDVVLSSVLGSQLVQLRSCTETGCSQRGCEAVNTEADGSTELEAVTRQRLVKTQ
jgi:hypothetical protein